MISLSRCPHAGQTIVDRTAAIEPLRRPGTASTQEDRLEGSARPPIPARYKKASAPKPGPFHANDRILGIQDRCSPLTFATPPARLSLLPRHAHLYRWRNARCCMRLSTRQQRSSHE